jgi:leucyl aminopeptidase
MLNNMLNVTTDNKKSVTQNIPQRSLVSAETARASGVTAGQKASRRDCKKVALTFPADAKHMHEFSIGFGQGVCAFSMKKNAEPVTVAVVKKHYDVFAAAALGIVKARQLVMAPANLATPIRLRDEIESLANGASEFKSRVHKLTDENFTFTIGRSSENTPKLMTVVYRGNPDSDKIDVGLALKGCTFDSGGINMKPSASVGKMKKDMGASAVGIGLLQWLQIAKPKVNVLLGFSFAENAVSSTAMRTGDIYPFKDVSVEITNTDAEGRLLLADAMLAMSKHGGTPKNLIAVGTLTALGKSAFGARYIPSWMQDAQVDCAMEKAGRDSGDAIWSMPLHDGFYEAIKSSRAADYVNSTSGCGAASGVAAVFLHEMAKQCYGEDVQNFTMLDISSSAMGGDGVRNYAGDAVHPQDASGKSLNLLIHRILQEAE